MMKSWKNAGRRPFEANLSRELTEVPLMPSTPKITHAAPHDNYTLTLTFSNGEQRSFDLKPHLDTPVLTALRDLALFRQVQVVYGSLEWPGERDLAYDMLYAESTPLPAEVE